jgi:HEAT repeat protein
MVNEGELDRDALIAASRRAAAPILAELAELGFDLEWVSDLYNKPQDYRRAIPTLIRWLPLVSDSAVKGDIANALATKSARPTAARPLIEEFGKAPETEESGLKWAIANALSEVADDSVYDEIVELVRDKRHGYAREMLAVALARMKDPRAVEVLVELLEDEQVAGHAVLALRKLAVPETRAAIEPFAEHPRTWVRREARRALEKIDRKIARARQKGGAG